MICAGEPEGIFFSGRVIRHRCSRGIGMETVNERDTKQTEKTEGIVPAPLYYIGLLHFWDNCAYGVTEDNPGDV